MPTTTLDPELSRRRTQIAANFRRHVRTKRAHPKGRIHKEDCQACGAKEGQVYERDPRGIIGIGALEKTVVVDAHHVDYNRPGLVTWLCHHKCHREAHAGTLKITDRMLWNYSSLLGWPDPGPTPEVPF